MGKINRNYMSRKTILLCLHAVSQQTQASPPSFNLENSSCKEVCKRCWANSVPVQQLFYHWSATGSLSTLWSSQEFISSPLWDFLIHLLLSLSCIAEAFPPLLWRRKNLFIHKVPSESKSSSEDRTRNLPPQGTNIFFRRTCEACHIPGPPLSKRPWKREVRNKQHYSTEETWPLLVSASWPGKHMDKQLPPSRQMAQAPWETSVCHEQVTPAQVGLWDAAIKVCTADKVTSRFFQPLCTALVGYMPPHAFWRALRLSQSLSYFSKSLRGRLLQNCYVYHLCQCCLGMSTIPHHNIVAD